MGPVDADAGLPPRAAARDRAGDAPRGCPPPPPPARRAAAPSAAGPGRVVHARSAPDLVPFGPGALGGIHCVDGRRSHPRPVSSNPSRTTDASTEPSSWIRPSAVPAWTTRTGKAGATTSASPGRGEGHLVDDPPKGASGSQPDGRDTRSLARDDPDSAAPPRRATSTTACSIRSSRRLGVGIRRLPAHHRATDGRPCGRLPQARRRHAAGDRWPDAPDGDGYPHGTMAEQTTPAPVPDPGAAAARAKTGIPRNPGRHDLGMKATLLFPDREIVERYYVPLIYTACRTCYSELEPGEIFRRAEAGEIDPAKMQKLISGVIESGHGSTIEHVVFTFGISGVSRTLSHQLVRHRAGRRLRPAEPALRRRSRAAATMLPGHDRRGGPGPAGPLRGAGRRRRWTCTATCWRPASRARTPASSSPTQPARTWS